MVSQLARPALQRMLWVLILGLFLARSDGVEVLYQVPNPLPQDMVVQGWLQVQAASLPDIVDISVEEMPGVHLEILTRELRRIQVNDQLRLQIGLRLRIDKPGITDLPVVSLHIRDGQRLHSTAHQVEVSAPLGMLRGDLVAGLRFSPPMIVPGETSEAISRLFIRRDSGWQTTRDWSIDLPDWALSMGETRQYQGYVLDESGQLWHVQTAHQPLTVSSPGSRVLGGSLHVHRQASLRHRESETVPLRPGTLIVQDIAGLKRPSDDRGIVGPISLQAQLDREQISMGEGVGLSLSVQGRQAALVSELAVPEIPGLRIYATETRSPQADRRNFRWQIVPQHSGSFDIPAWTLPWLNPEGPNFERAHSSPLRLTVLPGRLREIEDAPLENRAQELPPPLLASDMPSYSPQSLAAVALAAALTLALSGLARRCLRRPRVVHRGQRLAQALQAQDLAGIDRLAQQLLDQLSDAQQRAACLRAIQGIEAARFGRQDVQPADLQALQVLKEFA